MPDADPATRTGRHTHAAGAASGCDTDRAAQRAALLTARVLGWERSHADTAQAALRAFREHVEEHGYDESRAADLVLDRVRSVCPAAPAARGAGRTEPTTTPGPTAGADPTAHHALMVRIGALNTALGKLATYHTDAAEAAIGLYQQYRDVHGLDEDQATAQALHDTHEGIQAITDIAIYETDDPHTPGPDHHVGHAARNEPAPDGAPTGTVALAVAAARAAVAGAAAQRHTGKLRAAQEDTRRVELARFAEQDAQARRDRDDELVTEVHDV